MSKNYNGYSCGMVYIMTNSAECNQIAAFYRNSEGLLSLNRLYKTQGRGT